MHKENSGASKSQPNLFSILVPYKNLIFTLILLALLSNGLTLWLPKIISHGVDGLIRSGVFTSKVVWQFGLAGAFIFLFTYLQSIVQTYASEKIARDIRNQISEKISERTFGFVQKITPAKLLTNLTSDIDSIKMFVAQAIVNIVSSLVIIVGASILLLSINWKLGLGVLVVVPIIGGTFFVVLGRVRQLFLKAREIIDWLNKVINESILGSSLIRVMNSERVESEKFLQANSKARDLGLSILKLFASMIPVITFATNLAVLIILSLGGKFVINGSMSLGDFAAFNSYLAILIFPILIIGFMSNIIAQAQASYGRIVEVLTAQDEIPKGSVKEVLTGSICIKNLNLKIGEKTILKNVNIEIAPKSKTAIIGPTAAGKTQLLNLLIGLMAPDSGSIEFNGKNLQDFDRTSLYSQVGLVFQDSIVFNMSLRENIAFNTSVSEESLEKAIETAELKDFISSLSEGLNSVVSERGTSLSGGQKQRVMLARSLALNPKILLLDDFTARVDTSTEKRILENVQKNYPDITLVSVTQKIGTVEHYDQIIVLMEGEVVASGTHKQLLDTSPEYVQIYESQQSTNEFETDKN